MTFIIFVILARETWPEAKIAIFWQPGTAVVTGFREKWRPLTAQESLATVLVRTTLRDGRQVPGFTVNDEWRLKNWPREAVPRQLGDALAVYVDPRDPTRVIPKHAVDAVGLGLFTLLFGFLAIRFAMCIVESQRRLAEEQRSTSQAVRKQPEPAAYHDEFS